MYSNEMNICGCTVKVFLKTLHKPPQLFCSLWTTLATTVVGGGHQKEGSLLPLQSLRPWSLIDRSQEGVRTLGTATPLQATAAGFRRLAVP